MTFAQPLAPSGLTGFAAEIARGITDTIRDADSSSERSLQKALGVSEVGDPCDRKLMYRMFGHPSTGVRSDPWKANIGTAMHEYLRWIYQKKNEQHDGADRYLLEQRVTVGEGLRGTCDVFDRKLHLVADYKSKADAKACKKASGEPGRREIIQAHCYGQGWVNQGEIVDHVALVYLPRNGDLDNVQVWTEPFDPQVVVDALARRERLVQLGVALDVENRPQMYGVVPANATAMCSFCPYFLPNSTDAALGCAGHTQPKEQAA